RRCVCCPVLFMRAPLLRHPSSSPRAGAWSRLFFFFQAEDGIRARNVTGVQTCALPISKMKTKKRLRISSRKSSLITMHRFPLERSEERRVGKECRAGGAAEREKRNERGRRADEAERRRRGIREESTRRPHEPEEQKEDE